MPRGAVMKPATQTKYYPFNGGLDVVTPALSVDPGFALAMVNYEPWFNGGYRRIDGYERYDGHAAPSSATVYGATMSAPLGISVGTAGTLGTGSVSGATGAFVEAVTVSGTGWVAVTNISGTFGTSDHIVIGTSTSTGTLTAAPSPSYAPSGTGTSGYSYTSEFLANAQNYYRVQIGTVPGTGNVLGIWQNKANVYAWRLPVGGGAARCFLASGTGWTTSGLTYCSTMYFTGLGTSGTVPANGQVVTGASSGATGTCYTSITHTTVAGYVALTGVTGTFGTSEALKIGGVTWGTSSSACTQFSFPSTGGTYQFINENFYATSPTYNVYGVNGQGPAFQIDESNIICPILLPQTAQAGQPTSNTPFLICEYQNYLGLAFVGGIFQLSVIGVPLQYNGFLGSAQFGVGEEITGLFSMVAPALIITTRRNTQYLTGNTSSTFDLQIASEKAGAILYSGQLLDTVYAVNNLGITSMSRTQSYGNFVGATVSQLIQPILQAEKNNFTCSTIVRTSNECRFYFSDGSALIMYVPGLGQQNKAWSAIESGVTAQFGYANYPAAVEVAYNTEDASGNEIRYFATTDGYVYHDGIGTSFDGAAVTSYVRLAFNNVGSPALRKYFRRADLEINSPAQINLKFAWDLSYSNTESSSATFGLTASNITAQTVFGGGGYWDSVNWDNFLWDGQTISTARASLNGTGENISFLIFHQAIVDMPFILQGLVLHFDPRRLQR